MNMNGLVIVEAWLASSSYSVSFTVSQAYTDFLMFIFIQCSPAVG
jgi:hypothetical protein